MEYPIWLEKLKEILRNRHGEISGKFPESDYKELWCHGYTPQEAADEDMTCTI